jgi:hypothetical protein
MASCIVCQLRPASGYRPGSSTQRSYLSPPLVTSEAVFVLLADSGTDHRALLSLKTVKWRLAASDRWSTRVIALGQTIFLGTPTGSVTGYCAAGWSHKLGDAPIRAIGGSRDMPYVGTPKANLYAIRAPNSCTE